MKLEEVLPAYRKGKKIRRKKWPPEHFISIDIERNLFVHNMDPALSSGDRCIKIMSGLHADDWEVYKDTSPEAVPSKSDDGYKPMRRRLRP